MPAAPVAWRLRAAAHERLLVLEPAPDSAPVVVLTLPTRDSILRKPTGQIRFTATATDDYGLASGVFELIVSSGGGENFTFKARSIGTATFTGKTGELAATISLDTLDLKGGDMLHLRAVVRDRNNVTGPASARRTRARCALRDPTNTILSTSIRRRRRRPRRTRSVSACC